jgi:hypothetical protein
MDRRNFLRHNSNEERAAGKGRRLASGSRVIALLVLLGCGTASLLAQHTKVEKNGLAGTIETDYNAADKATEMRTIGTDGKIQQKVDYEYLPGYQVPQQTDTSYWPNGQLRKVVRKNYDESANFMGEFVQIFDDSGKQVGGHKLTHDPWKGTYRCSEWNASTQNYRIVACPSGEEDSSGPGVPKKFTYDEVMKHFEAARKEAAHLSSDRSTRTSTASSTQTAGATAKQEVGIVMPSELRVGERVSGSVVENPDRYREVPEVTVTRVAVPFESGGDAARLSGWSFEVAGENPQRADGPITFVVPGGGSELNVTFRQAGNPDRSVSATLHLAVRSTKEPRATSFRGAALCLKGELCAVSGPFGGDGGKTFAAFEDRPATIVAETSDRAYVMVPDFTQAGARALFIAEGAMVVALPVVVGDFFIKNNGRELQAGETLITFPTLDGPGDIPDDAWRAGNFPATNLERARRLIPGFELGGGECRAGDKDESEEKREAEEKEKDSGKKESEEKEEDGRILLVVKNLAPDESSLHSAKNGVVVFCLSDEAFQRGVFKYDLRIDARKAGKAAAAGYVIPFLAPVAGQEFRVKGERP